MPLVGDTAYDWIAPETGRRPESRRSGPANCSESGSRRRLRASGYLPHAAAGDGIGPPLTGFQVLPGPTYCQTMLFQKAYTWPSLATTIVWTVPLSVSCFQA